MSDRSAAESALTPWDRERAEEPFLFYRGPRGHFDWLSYEAAARDGCDLQSSLPANLRELIEVIASERRSAAPALARGIGSPPGGRRDLWISWRSPQRAEERALLFWAVESGAAIVVERCDSFPAELACWVRPTLLNGTPAELVAWLERLEAETRWWRRPRWFRRRLSRLRRILVEAPADSSELSQFELRLRRLAPDLGVAVSPFPPEALV